MNATWVEWAAVDPGWLLPKRYLTGDTGPSKKLGELVEIASGTYVEEYCASNESDARPYLRVDNVRAFLPNLTDGDLAFVRAGLVKGIERVSVRAGDVVVARTGTLGKAFVVDESLAGAVLSQHLTRLRPRDEIRADLPSSVLTAYLNSHRGQDRIYSLAGGSTRPELTHNQLALLEIPHVLLHKWPELAEDRLIPLATEIRNATTEALAQATELFGEAPSGPADECRIFEVPGNVRHYESLLPRFHSPDYAEHERRLATEFDCQPLGNIADVFRGAGTRSAEYERSGIPFVMPSSLINGGIELFPEHYGSTTTYRRHAQSVGAGDVLISIEGKIGLVALLGKSEEALVKNHIEIVRIKDAAGISPELLYAFLASRHGLAQFERRFTVQATIPGIGSSSRSILIPIKSRGNPSRFRRAVDRIEEAVRRSVRARVELRQQLSRLLDQVQEAVQQP